MHVPASVHRRGIPDHSSGLAARKVFRSTPLWRARGSRTGPGPHAGRSRREFQGHLVHAGHRGRCGFKRSPTSEPPSGSASMCTWEHDCDGGEETFGVSTGRN